MLKSGSGYFSKAEYQVKLSSGGFKEKIVPITYKLNGWYIGNLLIGGVIGFLIVDPLTGAMYKVKDPAIFETMTKTSATAKAEPAMNIINLNDVSDSTKVLLVKL